MPIVHVAAALTALGWLFLSGWHAATINAVAVLLITCPCALGLAIPAVQVAASGALFREGVLLNAGDTLERLSGIDTIVFDKTGTLTLPEPVLADADRARLDPEMLALAARLALSSRHPMAGALSALAANREPVPGARESAGLGIEARIDGVICRLGSPRFCGAESMAQAALATDPDASVLCFRRGEAAPVVIPVRQHLRPDARETIETLRAAGYRIVILSGDHPGPVAAIAAALEVVDWQAERTPQDKIAAIEAMRVAGRRVLMVGDGINDAPALAAADVSLSPVTAAHVSQAAADALFLGRRLAPVVALLATGRRARRSCWKTSGSRQLTTWSPFRWQRRDG